MYQQIKKSGMWILSTNQKIDFINLEKSTIFLLIYFHVLETHLPFLWTQQKHRPKTHGGLPRIILSRFHQRIDLWGWSWSGSKRRWETQWAKKWIPSREDIKNIYIYMYIKYRYKDIYVCILNIDINVNNIKIFQQNTNYKWLIHNLPFAIKKPKARKSQKSFRQRSTTWLQQRHFITWKGSLKTAAFPWGIIHTILDGWTSQKNTHSKKFRHFKQKGKTCKN